MKNISFEGWLAIIAVVFPFGISYVCPFINGVVRVYNVDGETYPYLLRDLVFYISQDIGQILFIWALRIKFRDERLTRCILQWAIDLIITDIGFVIFSNPYVMEHSKILMNLITIILFFIIYYWSYVNLIFYNIFENIKDGLKKKQKVVFGIAFWGMIAHYVVNYFLLAYDKKQYNIFLVTIYFCMDVWGFIAYLLTNNRALKGLGALGMILGSYMFYRQFTDPDNWEPKDYLTLLLSFENCFFIWTFIDKLKNLK